MIDRADEITRFIETAGWNTARRLALAGDASPRRYERLILGVKRAVLMDAPPARGEDTRRFTRMARWLHAKGYSAPAILTEDHDAGLVLVEDLGDDLFARLMAQQHGCEASLYGSAIDFLADLHGRPTPPFVAPLDAALLAELVELTPKWYLAGIGVKANEAALRVPDIVADLYRSLADERLVTSLRDFHAENLIWLPDRTGVARVGLLDFQDAVAAHPAYDLVSLLQDARRDVSVATEAEMVRAYTSKTGVQADTFVPVYALLGAQRALRIVGVFARLCLHFGKAHYLDYLPRVWRYLERNLTHPALTPLRDAVRDGLPEPTPDRIGRIQDQCGQYPTP